MKERVLIGELAGKEGQEVTINAIADVRRDQGKMVFFDFRDRSGVVQGVVLPNHADAIVVAKEVTVESALVVTGIVNKRPEKNVQAEKQNGAIELEVTGNRNCG
jgi:aspartyl-tRNA synthetase